MMGSTARTLLVLLTIGTFVSARQTAARPGGDGKADAADPAPAESVFAAADGALDLQEMASSLRLLPAAGASAARADTVETYDIQLEQAEGNGLSAKTIAGLVVIGLFVAVAVYVLIGDDEEAQPEDGEGKPLPDYSRGFTIPIP